jgi:hypothetical protein
MKRFIAVIVFVLIAFVWVIPGTCLTDRFERTYDKTQTFNKPIKEKNSKVGVWRGSANIGTTDPKNVFMFEDEFIGQSSSGTANDSAWLCIDGFTVQDDAPGGEAWLTITAGSLVNAQVNGESFQCTDENKLYFETKVNITDADTASWFIGLAITDTSILAGVSDAIGFNCPDDTGDIDFCVIMDSTNVDCTDTGFDLEDGTAVRLAFSGDCSSTNVQSFTAYINDNPVAHSATRSPYNEALTPSYEFEITDSSTDVIEVDYIKIIQER